MKVYCSGVRPPRFLPHETVRNLFGKAELISTDENVITVKKNVFLKTYILWK